MILFWIIAPAVVVSLGMTLLCVYAGQYALAAYCAGGLAFSCAALRWAWPKEKRRWRAA